MKPILIGLPIVVWLFILYAHIRDGHPLLALTVGAVIAGSGGLAWYMVGRNHRRNNRCDD